jgi:hypothetical protein
MNNYVKQLVNKEQSISKSRLKISREFSYCLDENVHSFLIRNIQNFIPYFKTKILDIKNEKSNSTELKSNFYFEKNGLYFFFEKYLKHRRCEIKFTIDELNYSILYSNKLIGNKSSNFENESSRKKFIIEKLSNDKSRHSITKNEETFQYKNEKAIIIQKYLRGFIFRKLFISYHQEIIRKIINFLVKIQCKIRRYLGIKKAKLINIISHLLTIRRQNIFIIKRYFERFKSINDIKKNLIIYQILKERSDKIKKIKNVWKCHYISKKVKDLIIKEKNCYNLAYPYLCKKVRLIIYINTSYHPEEKYYDFEYCKFRNIYVLYIDPKDFKPGMYRAKLIVDNILTCDGRFPHAEFSDGNYYNILDFSLQKTKKIISLDMYLKTNDDSYGIVEDHIENSDSEDYISANSSIVYNQSSNSFSKEIKQDKLLCEIDLDLKKNLENKEAHCYLEILKESISKELNGCDDSFDI